MPDTFHLYSDLAWLWPLWGDARTEYADYCQHLTGLIQTHATRPPVSLLDIGCGGGKNVLNLKQDFEVTGLDISPVMLAQAQTLNPECRFVQGDMRSFQLDEGFDVVLMDDALSYMASLADFKAALQCAHAHLNPGGLLLATPDVTPETFCQNQTTVTTGLRDPDRPDLEVVFIENTYDPDPSDTQYETTVMYLIREQGRLRIETDHWTLGIFSLDTWRQVLHEIGFSIIESRYGAGEESYTVFVCSKDQSTP